MNDNNNGFGYPNGNNFGGTSNGYGGNSYPGSPYSQDNQQTSYPGSPYSQGSQQSSYPGSPYSQDNQQSSYPGSPYSQGNQQSSYSGSPQYSSNDNYDPNAPLYDPSMDAYDPNAPLYHPEPSMYSQTGVAVRKKSNGLVIIIAVLLGLALVFVLYMYNNQKMSLKDFLETRQGKAEIATIEDASKDIKDTFDIRWYTVDDNKLVLEYKYKEFLDLNIAERKELSKQMEKSMKENEWQAVKSIDDMIKTYKLEDFSIMYDYKDASGTSLFQYEVFSSQHGKETSV